MTMDGEMSVTYFHVVDSGDNLSFQKVQLTLFGRATSIMRKLIKMDVETFWAFS